MIAPGKIVTQDRDLYRVDGYLVAPEAVSAETNVPFELEMQCFNLRSWQKVVHADDSLCDPAEDPDDTFECGVVYCPTETTTWTVAEVRNDSDEEFCLDFGVDLDSFHVTSLDDYKNAGVYTDLC